LLTLSGNDFAKFPGDLAPLGIGDNTRKVGKPQRLVIFFEIIGHNCAPFIRFEVRAVGWRGVNREDLVTALVTMFGLDTNALQNTVETTEVIAAQLGQATLIATKNFHYVSDQVAAIEESSSSHAEV